MSTSRYLVPATQHRTETVEKKSRFIATTRRIRTPEEAKAFVDELREEFPDARHHCWAYVAGTPGSSHPCGMSDDGEPHGTAGRPMLQVLQHCGIGEIMVIVTRYFGGTKLGTGGLVRAYSGAVQALLESLPTEEAVDKASVQLSTSFEYEQALRHQLDLLGIAIEDVEYGSGVKIHLFVPIDEMESMERQLTGSLLHGAVEVIID